jgi:hypothetical protein
MNVAIFLDIALCNPYVNRRFGGTHHIHLQSLKLADQETRVQKVLATEDGYVHNYRCENLRSYKV